MARADKLGLSSGEASLFLSLRALGAVVVYAGVYAGSLAVLARDPSFAAGESVGALLIFGLLFAGAGWLATRGVVPRPVAVRAPGREMLAITVYLALFAVLVLGWMFTVVRDAVTDGRAEDLAILAVKLVTMVALPAWLFTGFGYSWRELLGLHRFDGKLWRALAIMAVLLLALQLVVGQGPKRLAALTQPAWLIALSAPFALLWMTVEAGLTEELLFRVLLQTRASAWLRSEAAGVVAMSLLFAVVHAPGIVMRGQHVMEGMRAVPDALTAVAYTIAVVSPIGIMFGVLWARTRSLLLLMLLHGWTDLVPNLAPFVQTWTAR